MLAVDTELRARGSDARRALVGLYDHPNTQVRLRAAIYTLAVAPMEARKIIDAIWEEGDPPYALDAGSIARRLDDGSYVPD